MQQTQPNERQPIERLHKTPVPSLPEFAKAEHAELTKQVEAVTASTVEAVREVVKTAEQLERLVIENAARVHEEISGHIALAGRVKQEASQLSTMITAMRDHQLSIAKAHRAQ